MMLALADNCCYHLYRKATDMRKGFDGLCGLIRAELKGDPLQGDVFIFLNRQRNRLKLLHWEEDGFAIYYKRLEQGTYELPEVNDEVKSLELSREKLLWILQGIELKSIKKRKRFSFKE